MAKGEIKTKYLIVGNSAGGIGAAEAIREVDREGMFVMVSDEPYPAYSRPLISEYLAGKRTLEGMLFRSSDFYQKNNILTFFGRKVVVLDPVSHTLKLAGGRKLIWEKLLLACGGKPIIPRIEGIERKEVFSFTTLDNAKNIGAFLDERKRELKAVVIGGGLIGVSAAEALTSRGVEVTIVEMKERILNTILDEEISALEETNLKKAGVEVITGQTVIEVTSYLDGQATGVILDDGQLIPCDLVVVAIGVLPRTELVQSTEIEVNRGILVNRDMQTSVADVYACGDVAEAYDFLRDENRCTPIWPGAYIGGRVAGFNMAGVTLKYPGGTAMNALKYFGLDVVSAGMVSPPDETYEVLSRKSNGDFRKVILKDGLLVGMVLSGNVEKSGILLRLMRDKVNVCGFKEELVGFDFGLASLPGELWRPEFEVSPSRLAQAKVEPEVEEIVAGE